ncbi:hypothetical protein FBU30_010167 [Linnemannia zychae]|nr:hypothetical protein FBU30_010167 [Linnemannia zychae]
MSSSSPFRQSSTNELFEEQASYLLRRNTLPFEDLLKSFQTRYRFQNSGALSDAVIKSAERIINRQPNADIKEWANTLIIKTKSPVFTEWYKSQKQNPSSTALNRAGRQHINQVIGEVNQSFSSIASAIGERGRSQALGPHSPSTTDTSTDPVRRIDLFSQPITSPQDDQCSSEHYIAEGSKKHKLNSGQAIPAQVDALNEGACTPPRQLTVESEIPMVADMAARFHHVDAIENNDGTEHLSETNLKLLESATIWYKKLMVKGIDQMIISMREERYPIAWIHDLIYDRLKLLRKGGLSTWDENTYTSFWVNLDLMALYTGIDDLMALANANENHFSPSAWRRSLVRDHPHSKGTNVDGFYAGKDGMIDIIVENVGAPSSSNYTKKLEDERKCWRNTADALLERYYLSTGSFEVSKEYNVISMIIYGLEVSLYVTSILGANSYQVKKIFRGQYHTNKDAYLTKIMIHLKLCLLIKTVMERNQDVAKRFDETIDSLPKHAQACFNLKLHLTPTKKSKDV